MVNFSRLLNNRKNNKKRVTEKFGNSPTTYQIKEIFIFLAICLGLIMVTGFIAYRIGNSGSDSPVSLLQFLGFSNMNLDSKNSFRYIFMVSLVSGIVFGFIDNGGLYFGMDKLDPILPGDELEKAGWGNTFSDVLGSFLATFIGSIVRKISSVSEDPPLIADSIGIFIGCILGIYIPKAIKEYKVVFRKKDNSSSKPSSNPISNPNEEIISE